jgi:cytochrome c oxidase cbb3-type subunit 2
VKLPKGFAPAGVKIVARQDALDLVEYLKALDHTYPVKAIPVIEKLTLRGEKSGVAP